ncbi:ABC transporter permease [Nesterenkonia sp. NBAIMH1]|uniref:ABC transporter permease n=1 Tax=Nesterenkonia sp. NBAIMH1 TaxID=2600320 RepID=UPI001FEE2FA8|nr:ABC transporter permease [Nesterenkonia sp. NBAIMH1]
MKTFDLIRAAFGNTLRAKMRTGLTVVAIVIGAFTLTLTSGLGAGINQTLDRIVAGFGEDDAIYVIPSFEADAEEQDGPAEYDPDAATDTGFGSGLLTGEDMEYVEDLDGVTGVDASIAADADYLETQGGDQYQLQLDDALNAPLVELAAGSIPASDEAEITIPEDWLTIFDTDSPEDAIGQTVLIAASSAIGEQSDVEAEIVGVTQGSLAGVGFTPIPSVELTEQIADINAEGYEGEQPEGYMMAALQISDLEAYEQDIKDALDEEGMMGLTVEDQIAMFEAVIDTVTWVLSAFALIALLAASFGIVNTLLMSVQERTREIGLMKALGMSSGRVFGLFSLEAVVIGLMGSIIGIASGLVVGFALDAALTGGEDPPLGDFAELSLFGLNFMAVGGIFALIIAIAFLAGTLPAMRAARKDPIEALRYE